MMALHPKQRLSLGHRVALTTGLFIGGVGGFMLAGYIVIAILSL